jgi:hypothetical protein
MSDHEFFSIYDYLPRGVKKELDSWTREIPLSLIELMAERKDMRARNNELGYTPDSYTCDDCAFAPRCKLAFDAYNDQGDCLLSK